jgi:hypothetical protein
MYIYVVCILKQIGNTQILLFKNMSTPCCSKLELPARVRESVTQAEMPTIDSERHILNGCRMSWMTSPVLVKVCKTSIIE